MILHEKNRFVLFVLFIFASCDCTFLLGSPTKIRNDHIEKDDIINCGVSEKVMEGKYEHYVMMFDIHKSLNKAEAINLVNEIYLHIIKKINQDPSLQKELAAQFASKENLHVEAFFVDKSNIGFCFPEVFSCEIYEKYSQINFKRLQDKKNSYIMERIYYEYD